MSGKPQPKPKHVDEALTRARAIPPKIGKCGEKTVVGNKQLAHHDFAAVKAKADAGLALSLRELAVRTGFGYTQVRGWTLLGLPLFQRKIFWSDFLAWKATRLETALAANNGPKQPLTPTGKPDDEINLDSPTKVSRARGVPSRRHSEMSWAQICHRAALWKEMTGCDTRPRCRPLHEAGDRLPLGS